MFHEVHDLTNELKASDRCLHGLSGRRGMLDQTIGSMEVRMEPAASDEIRVLNNKKRAIKAERYSLLLPISLARTGS